jgi:hypothetical protein
MSKEDQKENPEKKPVGRPSLYKPEYCEMLIEHMGEGLSFESFAAIINVSRSTLYEWDKGHEEFSDAFKRGVDKSLLYWEKLGRDNVLNKSESYRDKDGNSSNKSSSLNAAVYNMTMVNRHNYRNKAKDEAPDTTINQTFGTISDKDLDEKLDEKMKKLGIKK